MTRFSDLSPDTADNKLINEEAIKQSIRNIVLVNRFEMPGKRHLGSRLAELLFEEPDYQIKNLIEDEVKTLLDRFEPRIKTTYIDVQSDDSHKFIATIVYKIRDSFIGKDEDQTIRLILA